MKKIFLALITIVIFCNLIDAQNDTMYVMKSGIVVGKYNINTQVDSIIFYQPVIQISNTFTDSRDNNVYQTVTIGNQVWMAENLRYLPCVAGSYAGSTTSPYYYVYGYEGTNVDDAKATANYSTYGVLYNWAAAMAGSASSSANPSGVQGVCPTGWHLPSDAEWTELTTYLGGENIAGGKLKETGTTHWNTPNAEATNESGFTALPGGNRDYFGSFMSINSNGWWWSATELDSFYTWNRAMGYGYGSIGRPFNDMDYGFSVRCVRN